MKFDPATCTYSVTGPRGETLTVAGALVRAARKDPAARAAVDDLLYRFFRDVLRMPEEPGFREVFP